MKLKQIAFVALLCAVCAIPIALVGRQARTSIANGTSLPTTCALGDLFYLSTSNGTGALNACLSPSTWSPLSVLGTTTFYVAAVGAGGNCKYNGDGGTTCTPSDAGPCLTKALPCATIAGVAALVSKNRLDGIVTVQLADTAGTGTDCYRPQGATFQISSSSVQVDTALSIAEAGGTTGTYPSVYLYLQGNTTTPGNVIITGATTCAGTTANDLDGIKFVGGNVRVRGIQAQYFNGGTTGSDNGAFEFFGEPAVFAEDLTCTGSTATTAFLLVGWNSTIRMGTSAQRTITACGVIDALNNSHASFISPLGRSNLNVVVSSGWTAGAGLFTANEFSHMGVDGITLTVSGSGTANVWFAIASSSITWNDGSTNVAPAQTVSINGAGLTIDTAWQGSFINDLCRTFQQLTCNIGNTTAVSRFAQVNWNSYVQYNQNATGVNLADTMANNSGILQNGSSLTTFVSQHVNSTGAFQANGTNGQSFTCSATQGMTFVNGIVTAHTCTEPNDTPAALHAEINELRQQVRDLQSLVMSTVRR